MIQTNQSLTSDLISTSKTAFSGFVNKKLLKSLPTPVDPPSSTSDGLAHFDAILQKATSDAEFAKAAREKEEKFSMYLASLSKASDAIRTAEKRLTAQEGESAAVKELVDGAADVLGPYLGETVSTYSSAELILARAHNQRPNISITDARRVLGGQIFRRYG